MTTAEIVPLAIALYVLLACAVGRLLRHAGAQCPTEDELRAQGWQPVRWGDGSIDWYAPRAVDRPRLR